MIESMINKALEGNLDLVKKILADLDLIYFSTEEIDKINKLREKFKVKPTFCVHTTVSDNCGALPIKYWRKDGTFVNNEHRVEVQMELEFIFKKTPGMQEGQIVIDNQEFWYERI